MAIKGHMLQKRYPALKKTKKHNLLRQLKFMAQIQHRSPVSPLVGQDAPSMQSLVKVG